jgi:glutathione S-transferase
MRYELFYWPSIQGRGEFVRLALEEAGADYVDVARRAGRGMGVQAMLRMMEDGGRVPFAPPFLRAGRLVIAQTANILQYLGPRLGLAPGAEAGRLWAHQLQLTVTDFVMEVHDTHHPIAVGLYYHQQKAEALRRTRFFLRERVPKYLDYFEAVLQDNSKGRGWMIGRAMTYVDLSMFQIVEGLGYAFPKSMQRMARNYPGLLGLYDRVAARPNIAAYLASKRRIPFNEDGIFRYYPELEN